MSTPSRIRLLDTNILIRFADTADPLNETTRTAVEIARQSFALRVTSQNLIECWNVLTRPRDRNGFGQTVAEAQRVLDLLEQLFPILPEPAGVFEQWRELVIRFEVSGVQVHDARLVASMLTLGISEILTFNHRDFARYSAVGIRAIAPNELVQEGR